MSNEFKIDTKLLTEKQIQDILNQNIKTIRKTISINNLQKKIQKGLSDPGYQKLYLRFQELNYKHIVRLITDDEINEFLEIVLSMRKYELSMIFKELLIII